MVLSNRFWSLRGLICASGNPRNREHCRSKIEKKIFFFVVIVFGVRVSDLGKSWIEKSLVMTGRYARNLEV